MIEKNTKIINFLEDLNSSDVSVRIHKLINFLDKGYQQQEEEFGFSSKDFRLAGKDSELYADICPSLIDILPILKSVNKSAFGSELGSKGVIEFTDVERITVEEYLKTL
jgi:hypothetical protein